MSHDADPKPSRDTLDRICEDVATLWIEALHINPQQLLDIKLVDCSILKQLLLPSVDRQPEILKIESFDADGEDWSGTLLEAILARPSLTYLGVEGFVCGLLFHMSIYADLADQVFHCECVSRRSSERPLSPEKEDEFVQEIEAWCKACVTLGAALQADSVEVETFSDRAPVVLWTRE